MDTILVTGVSGFVGKYLASELIKQGYKVVGLVRKTCFLPGLQELYDFDLNKAFDWPKELKSVDCVVHTAARVHQNKDDSAHSFADYYKANVLGTLNLARQAAKNGVKRFVFISTIKVNGEQTKPGQPFTEDDIPNPQDDYSLSKHLAEEGLFEIARQTGMEVVVIRPPLVYGQEVKANFANMIKVLQLGIPLPFGAVHNKRSFIFVGNLASIIIRCIQNTAAASQVFFASDGHDLSTTELLIQCAKAYGIKPRLVPVPQKWLEFCAEVLGKQHLTQRLCGSLQIEINKAKQYLAWTPPFTVEEGLKVMATATAPKD